MTSVYVQLLVLSSVQGLVTPICTVLRSATGVKIRSTAFFSCGQQVKAQFTRSKQVKVKGLQPVDTQNVELVQYRVTFVPIYMAATTEKVPRKGCETMHSRWKSNLSGRVFVPLWVWASLVPRFTCIRVPQLVCLCEVF